MKKNTRILFLFISWYILRAFRSCFNYSIKKRLSNIVRHIDLKKEYEKIKKDEYNLTQDCFVCNTSITLLSRNINRKSLIFENSNYYSNNKNYTCNSSKDR